MNGPCIPGGFQLTHSAEQRSPRSSLYGGGEEEVSQEAYPYRAASTCSEGIWSLETLPKHLLRRYDWSPTLFLDRSREGVCFAGHRDCRSEGRDGLSVHLLLRAG